MSRRCHITLTLVALASLSGCGLFASHGIPDDPLFIQRKPQEAKAVQALPSAITRAEPTPPANPYHAAVAASRAVPATLANRSSADEE